MTLLRRAPREVYRVYDEHEFFADAGPDESLDADSPAGERRLRRPVVTMLLAGAGAVGGLIAITSLSAGAGTRSRGGRASALVASGSTVSSAISHPQVWRGRAVVDESRRVRAAGRGAAPARDVRRASARPYASNAPHRRMPRIETTEAAPADVVASASVARLTARADGPRQRPRRAEFGFER